MTTTRSALRSFHGSIRMDIVKAMSIFVAIVEHGSFTSAARSIEISTACTSRTLFDLEKHLGVQLMHRTTRAVTLTDSGETYYRFCLRFLAELKEVEALLANDEGSSDGTIRVHVDKAIGMSSVLAHVSDFSRRYPGMRLEFGFNGSYQDSFRSGFDCAIAIGQLEPSSFRAARVCELQSVVVAAPGYLETAPVIEKPSDIPALRIVELSSALVNGHVHWGWQHDMGNEAVTSRCWMSVDDPEALLQAVRYGAGIARLARRAVCSDLKAGTLRELLPAYHLPTMPVWVMYRYQRFQPRRVCIFIEWLREWLTGNDGKRSGAPERFAPCRLPAFQVQSA